MPWKKTFIGFGILLALLAAVTFIYLHLSNQKGQSNSEPTPSSKPIILELELKPYDQSSDSGKVVVLEVENQITLTIEVSDKPKTPSPVHIHGGSCNNIGDIKFVLSPIINGVSRTAVSLTLDQLNALNPLVVDTHKSINAKSNLCAQI